MADSRIPTPAHRVSSRMIGDKALILDPHDDAMQRLNDVGSFIWSHVLKGERTVDEIKESVIAEFDVEPMQAQKDLIDFLARLEQKGLVAYQ